MTAKQSGSNLFQYLATFSCTFGLISYGVNVTWTSPFLPYLTSNKSTIPITEEEGFWLAMAPLLGCFIGGITGGLIADRFGRKKAIILVSPLVFICFIYTSFATDFFGLFLSRFLIGIADGLSFAVVPMYVGEISSPEIRGFLSSLITLNFIMGILLINVIGSFWNIYICGLISSVIPALHFFTFIFMPESPYWYLKVGRYDEARKVLQILRGTNDVNKQLEIMKTSVEEDTKLKSTYKELFMIKSNRKACLICILLTCLQRAIAKAALMLYTKSIFEQTGSNISPTISTIAYCLVELVVVAISSYFIIDRFGKRKLTIISAIGSIIPLVIIGVYFILKDKQSDLLGYLNWLPVTSLIMYNIFSSIAIGFVPFCYASELFPPSVKGKGLSVVVYSSVFTAIISARLFQTVANIFGSLYAPFLFFAALSTVLLILVIKVVPETKEYTLEEIQLVLKGIPITPKNHKEDILLQS